MEERWHSFVDLHRRLRSPLRPAPEDVGRLRHAIIGSDDNVVILGVTPELADLGRYTIALDGTPGMVGTVWPGDTHRRHGLAADWMQLPLADDFADTVIGDGSLNAAAGRLAEVLSEVRRVVRRSGVVAFRTFCSPAQPESLTSIVEDVARGWPGNFHALKWRIAMALAANTDGLVAVESIRACFNHLFPDRTELCAMTEWAEAEVATIDAYRDATHNILFPTRDALLAVVAEHFAYVWFEPASEYCLAERCPVVVLREPK